MFSMFIKAPTMSELRAKLIEAAQGMGAVVTPNQKPADAPEELGYGDDAESEPLEQAVYTPHEGVAKPAMPTFQAAPSLGEAMIAPAVNAVAQHIAANPPAGSHSETDAKGLPWDERIHASSKAKTKDGSWRTKRGVDEKFLADVEFELRAKAQAPKSEPVPLPLAPPVAAAPAPVAVVGLPSFTSAMGNALPPAAPQPLPLTQSPVYAPQAEPAPAPVVQQPAPVVAAAPTPPPAGGKPAHTLESFKANIIPTFVQLVQTGAVTQHYIEQLKEYFKVKEIWDVQNEPAKLQELFDNFVASGLVTRIG